MKSIFSQPSQDAVSNVNRSINFILEKGYTSVGELPYYTRSKKKFYIGKRNSDIIVVAFMEKMEFKILDREEIREMEEAGRMFRPVNISIFTNYGVSI